jgi:anti-sigma regulatory factor (Ser/Thr protein kinase)
MIFETQVHESLMNLAFAQCAAFWLLCTYDENSLDPTALYEARLSHGYLSTSVEPTSSSPEFKSEDSGSWPWDSELREKPADAQRFDVSTKSVGIARQALFDFAHAFGMSDSAAADCALAGHEVMSNSVVHGGGDAQMSIWREHETLICEVKDRGYFEDPLAGRTRPTRRERSGRGLWIANQLCDLVQIRRLPDGTAVRLHMLRRA